MTRVTVLTPVYNGAPYLGECIESVLAQTHGDWEYVIVDNASSDGSADIARSYAARDPRIRVHVNQEHVGVIENHNIAFRLMSSDSVYCKVVQADDWLFPECLERMVGLARAHAAVGVVSAYRLCGAWVDLDGLPWPSTTLSGRAICRLSLLGGPYVFGSPTSVLFRSDLVRRRDPFFDPASLHADEAACYDVLRESDFGFVHQVLTFTRVHDQDRTMSAFSRRIETRLAGNLWILDRYGPLYLQSHEYARRRRTRVREYYRALGRGLLATREREFWTFHRAALRALHLPLNPLRLGLAALGELARLLVCPERTLRILRGRWSSAPSTDPEIGALVGSAQAHRVAKAAELHGVSLIGRV